MPSWKNSGKIGVGVGSRICAKPNWWSKSASAREHIRGLGLGLDMTLCGVQMELKNSGEPWERAKAFEYSAPWARSYR
jgi:2-keto-4-pentenoate hydratase/2-oxohepta-3-ene-1,7-dioic acid hydratase in catechol pathway